MTADDEPHIRALLKAVLGQLGAEVVAEAADGAEAIRLFGEFKPDITLLDINMPKLTGDAALEQILRIKPDALVIMLSSQDSIDTVRRCIDLGARNYILKNTIDWVSRPAPNETPLAAFNNKIITLMSASPGALGGLRGLVHVRAIFGNIGAIVLPGQLAISKANEAFTPEDQLQDPRQQANVEKLGATLAAAIAKWKA